MQNIILIFYKGAEMQKYSATSFYTRGKETRFFSGDCLYIVVISLVPRQPHPISSWSLGMRLSGHSSLIINPIHVSFQFWFKQISVFLAT